VSVEAVIRRPDQLPSGRRLDQGCKIEGWGFVSERSQRK